MHEDDRRELRELTAAQTRLRLEMVRLDNAIAALTTRLQTEEAPAIPPQIAPAISEPEQIPAIPVVAGVVEKPTSAPNTPPPIPQSLPVVPPPPKPAMESVPPSIPPAKISEPSKAPTAPSSDSFEMQLGSVWLVRVGVIILLTGVVFLGNYAYHNFIGKLGPGGRLFLLYLVGAGLTAAGIWIERGKESVRNYARVLIGAGVSAIYYATYAAHFVSQLRVIESAVVGGGCLLLLSGGIVWYADRKRSETLATFAVLLSFYTGTVNPIAEFTLFSNLLLTTVSVIFLVRRQWTTMSALSLAGAYLSFGFWRYFHTGNLPWTPVIDPQFVTGLVMLTCYWFLFTAGLFICKNFPPQRRAAFLSTNNGAYFAFASVMVWGTHPGSYWLFPMGLGLACLVLAWLAQQRMRDETLADGAYLAQGLALVSIGLSAKLSGYQLALSYGLESAVLLTCSRQRHGWIYKIASVATGLIAFCLCVWRVDSDSSLALPVGGLLTLLFLYNARWSKRIGAVDSITEFVGLPALFVVLALALGNQIIEIKVPHDTLFPTLALASVFFAYALPLHGLVELALLGQFYLLGADAQWLLQGGDYPWWNPALLIVSTLAIVHWWQRQRDSMRQIGLAAQAFWALGVVLLIHTRANAIFDQNTLVLLTPVMALILLAYGLATRAVVLAVVGQFFVIVGVVRYFELLFTADPSGTYTLLTIAVVVANGMAIQWAFGESPVLPAWAQSGDAPLRIYRLLPLVMYIAWGFKYVPESQLFAFFAFSALGLFAWSVWSRSLCRGSRSGVLFAVALGTFWAHFGSQVSLINAVAILTLLATYHAAKRWARESVQSAFLPVTAYSLLATLWLFVTRWANKSGYESFHTVTWAVLAGVILTAGFALRDRYHRLSGLALLALALGRILFVDVWQMDSGQRTASFLVLGLVFVVVGYIYNRFPNHFRSWIQQD